MADFGLPKSIFDGFCSDIGVCARYCSLFGVFGRTRRSTFSAGPSLSCSSPKGKSIPRGLLLCVDCDICSTAICDMVTRNAAGDALGLAVAGRSRAVCPWEVPGRVGECFDKGASTCNGSAQIRPALSAHQQARDTPQNE